MRETRNKRSTRLDLTKVNVRLMQKVRDQIANEDTLFDMKQWGVSIGPGETWYGTWYNDHMGETVSQEACDTPACLAGWAIRLADDEDDIGKLANEGTDDGDSIALRGIQLLGLDAVKAGFSDCGHVLFFHEDWPSGYPWATPSLRRKSAIRLLDEIIAGRNPWASQ